MGGFLEVQSPGKNSNKSPVKKKAEKKSPNTAKNRGECKDDDHEANLTQMSKAIFCNRRKAKMDSKIEKKGIDVPHFCEHLAHYETSQSFMYATKKLGKRKNKAVHMTVSVRCGWAGAVTQIISQLIF